MLSYILVCVHVILPSIAEVACPASYLPKLPVLKQTGVSWQAWRGIYFGEIQDEWSLCRSPLYYPPASWRTGGKGLGLLSAPYCLRHTASNCRTIEWLALD